METFGIEDRPRLHFPPVHLFTRGIFRAQTWPFDEGFSSRSEGSIHYLYQAHCPQQMRTMRLVQIMDRTLRSRGEPFVERPCLRPEYTPREQMNRREM